MRIGLKNFFYKNIKKQQYAHTKSVARLVDSEHLSKKYFFFTKTLKNNNMPTQKSVATRLVDSENFSQKKKKCYTHTQKVLLD